MPTSYHEMKPEDLVILHNEDKKELSKFWYKNNGIRFEPFDGLDFSEVVERHHAQGQIINFMANHSYRLEIYQYPDQHWCVSYFRNLQDKDEDDCCDFWKKNQKKRKKQYPWYDSFFWAIANEAYLALNEYGRGLK